LNMRMAPDEPKPPGAGVGVLLMGREGSRSDAQMVDRAGQ
jgi:hypothetical protein